MHLCLHLWFRLCLCLLRFLLLWLSCLDLSRSVSAEEQALKRLAGEAEEWDATALLQKLFPLGLTRLRGDLERLR